MSAQTQAKWTEAQLKYAQFLARNKTTKQGEKRTKEQFAKALGVDPATLWRWEHLDGWAELIYEESLKHLSHHLPALNQAMLGKAAGDKRFQKASEAAYKVLMQQYALLKADKIDHTTDGKPLPTPIVPLTKSND